MCLIKTVKATSFNVCKEIIGIAVAVAAVGIAAAYLYLIKKTKVGCLDPKNFRDFKLVEKRQLSHNVAKFRFALPTPTSVLGLPIGQHISCRGKDSVGDEVVKPYTPTTLDSDVGYFELVIKMYPQGRMSHHFREMKVGDYLSVKGPKPMVLKAVHYNLKEMTFHLNLYLEQEPQLISMTEQ